MENRIQSIDIFRAITMLLMVWVNDFWTLSGVPKWLEHTRWDEDAMGFSDVIFPVFLFIVGLSIPFAHEARLQKGDSKTRITGHIAMRSAALLFMGVLIVNLDSYHETSTLLPKPLWQSLMTIGFFLAWNSYPRAEAFKKYSLLLKSLGWVTLVFLLAIYRSNSESGYNWIEPHWWGILGLIAWSYLICSIVQLYAGRSLLTIVLAWAALVLFNLSGFAPGLESFGSIRDYIPIVGGGSLPALTMAGCFVSVLYLHQKQKASPFPFLGTLVGLGLACIVIGFLLRPWGGISKIQATPSWTHICTGIALLAFAILYYIADVRKLTRWASFIKPAGVATLTCYLLPYVIYPAIGASGIELPNSMKTAPLGLATSMAFACCVVFGTGLLNRLRIRLRV